MKRILVPAFLLLLLALSGYAQSQEQELDQIRAWYREINSNLDQYRKVAYTDDIPVTQDRNPDRYSMEGLEIFRLGSASMTRFFDDESLVKIVVNFVGDREELTSEYYFQNNRLFFVDKTKTIYHKPKWHDEFDAEENSVAINRYYIKNRQLLKWVNPKITSVGKMNPSYLKHEAQILNDYKLYVSLNE